MLQAKREAFSPRLILDVLLDHWPAGVYQDAEETRTRPLSAVTAEKQNLQTHEFFAYQDESMASSWRAEGRTDANGRAMVHFLIQEDSNQPDIVRITMVVDELNQEMTDLYQLLKDALTS